ncbi:hypothetical protein QVD99_007205 [Batrachochytrium dendrobatidis]|nr:hypothetical protein O5D80_007519 [Batrachochytrium dendrobatidis]KAK5666449.1 hypothetical protein QVD99_007205 [Batrachochytrium dendrobatidis]
MELFSVESVQQALHQLLDSTADGLLKKDAESYLLEFQRAQIAWETSLQLLAMQNPSVQLFGAQTLYNKLLNFWSSFPNSKLDQVQQMLVQLLANSEVTSPWFVTAKIAQVIVILILKSRVDNPDFHFKQTVAYLLDKMSVAQTDSTAVDASYFSKIILELTGLIPEEMYKMDLDVVSKNKMFAAVQNISVASSEFSVQMLSHVDPTVRRLSLRCISSWIQHEFLPVDTLVQILKSLLFQLLQGSDFETTADAISEILGECRLKRVQKSVCELALDTLTSDAIYIRLSKSIQDQDESVVQLICKMLSELGKNHVEYFWENLHTQPVSKALDMLLDITSFPGYFGVDQVVTEQPFYFWFLFQEAAAEGMDMWANDDLQEQYSIIESRINQIFQKLLESLCIQVKYPPLHEYESWSKDDRDKFKSHRIECADTMLCCHSILNDQAFELVCGAILQRLLQFNSLPNTSIEELEAFLFALKGFSESVDSNANVCLDQIIQTPVLQQIDSLCTTHDLSGQLRNTCVSLLGLYADWLSTHHKSIGPAFEFVLSSLKTTRSCVLAANALRQICDSCRVSLATYSDHVINTCISVLSVTDRATHGKIIESLSMIIQALPTDEASPRLNMILDGILSELETLLVSAKSNTNLTQYRPDVLAQLEYLIACSHGANSFDDSKSVIVNLVDVPAAPNEHELRIGTNIANMIHTVIVLWHADEEMIQTACNVVSEMSKSSLPHLGSQCQPLISFFLKAVEQFPRACYLRTLSALTKYAASRQSEDEAGLVIRKEVFKTISTQVVERFATTSYMESHPDVVDEFVRMLYSFLIMHGSVVLQMEPGFMRTVVVTVILQGLKLQERLAVTTILKFVTDFINAPFEAAVVEHIVKDVLDTTGLAIIHELLMALGGGLPRSLVDKVSDALFTLICKYPVHTRQGLQACLAQPNFPSSLATPTHKASFLKSITSTRQGKTFRSALRTFSAQCRGLDAVGFG